MLIRAAAEGTDTFELNRNLVLTDGARADSVPNLEIETGEIEGAGHASATGRFDDEQLFYLQARGIPEDEARRLVVSRLLQRHHRQDRCPRGRRAPARGDRAEAGQDSGPRQRRPTSDERQLRARLRTGRRTGRGRDRGRGRRCGGGDREELRAGLRGARRVLARPDPAVRGRRRRLRDRVLAARLPVRPAHRRADQPARVRPGPGLPGAPRW